MAGELMIEKNELFYIPINIDWGDDKWRKDAACKGIDTSDFFSLDPKKVNVMKKVCDLCSVKKDCLQFALTNEISWGIYGGMTSTERNKTYKHVVSRR
jgi:WhiB family redox-sensing transcriptional regulator